MRNEDDLQFAILGPLEVHYRGCQVPIRGWREQMVLASMLLTADRAVTLDRLVETVWETNPPAAAAKAVRNSVSGLRRRFTEVGASASLIGTEPNGYRLRLDGCYLDARDFRDRVADARQFAPAGQPVQAAAALRDALALWRGQALQGLGGAVIEADAAALNEQRLTTLEECIDLELALGKHRELVSELQALAAENPLREQFAGQLMIALYRSGRQAEALEVYRHLASRLGEGLGIDPAAEITRLHEAILRQDPALDVDGPGKGPEPARSRGPVREEAKPEHPDLPGASEPDDADARSPGLNVTGSRELDVLGGGGRSAGPGGRRTSPKWRAALWSACAVGAIAVTAGGYMLWSSFPAPAAHAARSATRVSAARDNTDPYADGCTGDRKAVDWEQVYWPGGRRLFGTLVMYYSAACQAGWGYLYGPNSAAWTIHIITNRPSDHATMPWQFSGKAKPGSWGNVLSTRPGCVYIEAFVSSKAGTGPWAITPCFIGTLPETSGTHN
jgi:DNA-binding SARP family transcriptional activator